MKFHLLVSLVFVACCLSSAQMFGDNDEWMAARWAKLRKRQMVRNFFFVFYKNIKKFNVKQIKIN